MAEFCPSHSWDDYVQREDEVAAEELAWWNKNTGYVVQVVCAIISGGADRIAGSEDRCAVSYAEIVKEASLIVQEITKHTEDPCA